MADKKVAGVVVGIFVCCCVGLLAGYFLGREIHFRPPDNCKWQNWTQWSECSQQCGVNGTQHRNRSYSIPVEYGGNYCYGEHFEKRRCNVLCYNGGTTLSERNGCKCKSGFTGKCCECKVKDCKMSQWSDWSTCSRECGYLGTTFRTRNIDQTPECGGSVCTSSLTEQQPCNRICYNSGRIEDGICKCPSGYSGQCCECKIKHCKLTQWSDWSLCSHACGPLGTSYKIRDIQQLPECGGRTCPSVFSEQQPCNRKCYNGGRLVGSGRGCRCPNGFGGQCCDVNVQDCAMIPWSRWSSCSHTCGPLGKQFRIRDIDRSSVCEQTMFPSELSEEQPCNRIFQNRGTLSERRCNCPIGYSGICCECKIQDCVITSWGDWSTCSERCGDFGTRFRTRVVDKFPECGGIACTSVLAQQQPCNKICFNGGSLIALVKDCRCPDGFGGQCCDINVQDCAMIPWSQWSPCSHTCGPLGKQFRTRDIDRSSVCGQSMVPSLLSKEKSCNQFCLNRRTISESRCDCPVGYSG
ncbi:spondin-1-like [Anneissia japonica]|uniref:spondin-1-like n=1 Tax=Anneissia japonica TaxID=1529436 RepID=UPI0014256F85|nr:spondin-1-like [Anneissia japonica]